MPFSVSNLVNALGDDRITLHSLDQVMTQFDAVKAGSRITFITDEGLSADRSSPPRMNKLGMILWLPRGDVTKAFELAKTDPDEQYGTGDQMSALRNLLYSLRQVADTGADDGVNLAPKVRPLLEELEDFFQECRL